MTVASDAQMKTDAYLNRLRESLGGLKPEEIGEILEELRSHIADKAAMGGELTVAGVDAALAALGNPEELAQEYVTDAVLVRAEVNRSPASVLASLYGAGISFFLVALLKPFHPDAAGLWIWRHSGDVTYSVRLGFGAPPAGARELLGWTIVPVGLSLGFGLLMLTTHFALWSARQYRRSRALRQK